MSCRSSRGAWPGVRDPGSRCLPLVTTAIPPRGGVERRDQSAATRFSNSGRDDHPTTPSPFLTICETARCAHTRGKRPTSRHGEGEFPRDADSTLEEMGFELVWGFSCQAVVFGLLSVLCSERESRSSSRRLRSGSRSARRGQGTETVAELGGLPPSGACVSQRLDV